MVASGGTSAGYWLGGAAGSGGVSRRQYFHLRRVRPSPGDFEDKDEAGRRMSVSQALAGRVCLGRPRAFG